MKDLKRTYTGKSKKSITTILILFTSALVIRVFFLHEVFDYHGYFPKYVELARRLMGELSPRIEVFYSSPFYILLLAFLKSVLSLKIEQMKLLQVCVGSFNVVLIYCVGKEYFNSSIKLLSTRA